MTGLPEPARGLLRALGARLGDDCALLHVAGWDAEPWCSAGLVGARVLLDLTFAGAGAEPAADRLLDGLPDAELALPRGYVLDLAVDADRRERGTAPRVELALSVLVVEED